MLAVSLVLSPSSKLTMYDQVSKIGSASPIWLPSLLCLRTETHHLDHCATMGKHDLSTEIIVTHFGHDLSITVIRVNEIGAVKVVRVVSSFGQGNHEPLQPVQDELRQTHRTGVACQGEQSFEALRQ